jgi:glutaredoxin
MQTEIQSPLPADAAAEALPVLYLRPGCLRCADVAGFLDERGIPYRRIDVSADAVARSQMERLSRQTEVPTMDWRGDIIADFGVEELVPFLRTHNVKLEDS